jgi:hypothetical protein
MAIVQSVATIQGKQVKFYMDDKVMIVHAYPLEVEGHIITEPTTITAVVIQCQNAVEDAIRAAAQHNASFPN